jgi:phosphoribosyl 1,2-cyclic phosphodiesterase
MVEFCVLGSGSGGNASLLLTPQHHVMIDAGFAPDELAARMVGTGAAWHSLDAVILTHLHTDHLKRRCLSFCVEHGVVFFCHEQHAEELAGARAMKKLIAGNLLRTYSDKPFDFDSKLRFHPLQLSHDRHPTYGFRIETHTPERCVAIGYAADLGEAGDHLAHALADVDLLALEFNHDEHLERTSGRPVYLIERVLGRLGHLSNRQAADLLHRILRKTANGGPRLLLQLHLSRECNRPELAYQAAQEVIASAGAHTRVFSTRQDVRGTVHRV